MGVAVHRPRPEPHELQDLGYPLLPLGRPDPSRELQGLFHDRPDAHPGAQRVVRLLEHHLDARAEGAERPRIHREQVPPVESDRPRGGLEEAKDAPPGGRLSRAALADEGEGFARPDLERDVVDGLDPAAPVHREVLDEAVHDEEGGGHQTVTSRPAIAAALRHRTHLPRRGLRGVRHRRPARVLREGAPRRVGAAVRGGRQQRGPLGPSGGPVPGRRRGAEQPRAVGMEGLAEERPDLRPLDDPARVHHRHVPAVVGHDAEVPRDDERGDPPLADEPLDEVEDLARDGHVEARRRLVDEEDPRIVGEGHRDDDPLAHPPAHLVRVPGETKLRIGDPDHAEELDGPRHRLLLARVGVGADDLRDLVADRRQRIEVLARLRGGEGDGPAPNALELPFVALEEVRPLVLDPSPVDRERRIEQAEDRPHEHRLAGARFAHDPDRLPRLQVEGDPVQDPRPGPRPSRTIRAGRRWRGEPASAPVRSEPA